MNKVKKPSVKDIAKRVGIHFTTLYDWKKEGVDIYDDAALEAKKALDCEPKDNNITWNMPKDVEGTGIRKAVERLRMAEEAAHKDYIDAIASGSNMAAIRLKNWISVVEALRKMESEVPDIEVSNADSINREELTTILGDLFRNLKMELDSLPRRIANITEGKGKIEKEIIIRNETERIMGMLYDFRLMNDG